MRLYFSTRQSLRLPAGHRFPGEKYAMLLDRVEASGLFHLNDVLAVGPASLEQLSSVHQRNYVDRIRTGKLSEAEIRRIGLPWSFDLYERARRSVGATILACQAALQDGISANLGGGTHHAFPDHGEGYCIFNDVAVTVRVTQAARLCQRFVVIDCDVHQGNGTAAIFAGDDTVFTFSVHGKRNFPTRKAASDLDIALEDGSEDDTYLASVERGLMFSLIKSNAELAFYIAGADPYQGDRLGRLKVSKTGLKVRDELVLDRCMRVGLPVVVVMGGGYGKNIQETVDIHWQTISTAREASLNGATFKENERIQI